MPVEKKSRDRGRRRVRHAGRVAATCLALMVLGLPGISTAHAAAPAAPERGWDGDGDFGAVDHGTSSSRTFTLTKRALDLNLRIAVEGSPDFSIGVNRCNTLVALLAGTCTVDVVFTPTSCAPQAATLVARRGDLSDTLPLTGHTTAPSAACPHFHVAPTGSDDADGSRTAPLATLDEALSRSSTLADPTILLAAGSYSGAPGYVSLTGAHSGTTIRGGLDPATWTASPDPSRLTGSPQAVRAVNATGIVLADLTLSATAPAVPGASVYGLREISGSALTLRNVSIHTTDARPGLAGGAGSNGLPGSSGNRGESATSAGDCTPQAGGAGGAVQVPGGTGGTGLCGSGSSGSPGSGADGQPGGAPGAGGFGPRSPGQAGGRGREGRDGFTGQRGEGGIASTFGWLGDAGTGGQRGGAGTGGGGGGAGGGQAKPHIFSFSHSGGGGGGGGGGGTGGTPGAGGEAGGGAFGIYLHDSSVVLEASTITVGNGGRGGDGGPGGFGGGGGFGGPGGAGSPTYDLCSGGCDYGGPGGRGGDGGHGGRGGHGGGGAGGPSIGVQRGGSSTATTDDTTTITHGLGGASGLSPGGSSFHGAPGMAQAIA